MSTKDDDKAFIDAAALDTFERMDEDEGMVDCHMAVERIRAVLTMMRGNCAAGEEGPDLFQVETALASLQVLAEETGVRPGHALEEQQAKIDLRMVQVPAQKLELPAEPEPDFPPIRKLPATYDPDSPPDPGNDRVESGPIQFGDDWPGLFLRGDHAAYYWGCLDWGVRILEEHLQQVADAGIELGALRSLRRQLTSPVLKRGDPRR